MDQPSTPLLSVVVPVYNGAATIGRALDSLLAQDYPQDRYEIIVINDGSTDETAKVVAERETVQYVELPSNEGVAPALNAGLEVATGDIYVIFNDDCVAAPDYLSQLALGYRRLDKPLGVGGVIVNHTSRKVKGLTANYIEANYVEAVGSVNRGIDDVESSIPPTKVRRFLAYITANYRVRRNNSQDEYLRAAELYGSNASFPIPKLRQIGGWDTSMSAPAVGGIEDRDVCYRLHQRFPDHNFYVVRRAHLMLDQDPEDTAVSMRSYLLRPYRRGTFNYAFHVRNGLTPPIFPFPVLILLILLIDAAVAAELLPLLIVLLPQLCYGWWVSRALGQRRPMYLLFPYLQVAEETMVLLGLVRGYLTFDKKALRSEVAPRETPDRQARVNSG